MDLGKDKWKQALLLGVVTLVTAVIVGGGTYYYIEQKNDKEVKDLTAQLNTQSSSTIASQSSSSVDETADWKTYTNTEVNFSFKYPNDWSDVKLNVVNNLKNGKGGKFIDSSDGKTGVKYFDSANIFHLSAESKAYIRSYGPITSFKDVKVDPNWTVEQLNSNLNLGGHKVIAAKKLSDKSLLAVSYDMYEGSMDFIVRVSTPFNDEYPNLEIFIKTDLGQSEKFNNYVKNQEAKGIPEYNIDYSDILQTVANDIINDSYSTDIKNNIKRAQLIADSLVVDETLTWKTYTNTEDGYLIKYPADWQYQKEKGFYTNIETNQGDIEYNLYVSTTMTDQTPKQYYDSIKNEREKMINEEGPSYNVGEFSDVSISGIDFGKITGYAPAPNPYLNNIYLVNKNGYLYRLSYITRRGEGPVYDLTSYISIAEKIISTFQFTK